MADTDLKKSNETLLMEASILLRQASTSLFAAAQWTEDNNSDEVDRYTHNAMKHIEAANQTLMQLK